MTSPAFSSCLAGSLSRYLRLLLLSNGSDCSTQIKLLNCWDRFVRQQRWSLPAVTRELVEGYARSLKELHPTTRTRRLGAVRQFCLHLQQSQPQSYVPERRLTRFPAIRRIPQILDGKQVRSTMKAARGLGCPDALQPHAYSAVLGLMYTTGLRISEAAALNLADVHLRMPALLVRQGKFRKARWVPLSASAARALGRCIDRRIQSAPRHAEAPLWLNQCGRRLSHGSVYVTFRRLLLQCGIRAEHGPGPCLHDLRHSFAVRRLLSWYRQGRDVNNLLPVLATYMGHVGIHSTQACLQATAELLEQANRRFAARFRRRILPQGEPS